MSLWTKITGAVRSVAKSVAPIAAAAIPGVGAIAAPLVAGAVSVYDQRQAAKSAISPMATALMGPPQVGGGMVQTAGAVGQVLRGTAGMAARAGAGAIGRGAAKLVIQGKRVSLATLKRLIKTVGPEGVALALGMSIAQLGQTLFEMEPKTARRRRGISYADIARTRRTLRKMQSMQAMLACSTPRRTFTARRSTKACR
jgi:hypothetical protein